jgi:hypothetical protein
MRHLASSLLLASLGAFALTAQPIQYVESRKLFLLTTRDSSYAMGVDLDHVALPRYLHHADQESSSLEPSSVSASIRMTRCISASYPTVSFRTPTRR